MIIVQATLRRPLGGHEGLREGYWAETGTVKWKVVPWR